MPHKLLTGSFYPDLESALHGAVSSFIKKNPPLTPLPILVPSNLLKVYLRRRLVELGLPHIALEFFTLQQIVTRIASSQPSLRAPLPPFADELIADSVIEKIVAPDSYFARIRHAAGFRASLIASLNDLKEAGITPRIFPNLIRRSQKLNTEKFSQLAALFTAYNDALAHANSEDEADSLARAAASEADPLAERTDVFLYGFYDFNFLQRQLVTRIAAHHALTVFFPYHPSAASDELHTGGAYLYAEPTLRWFESLLNIEAEPFFADQNPLPETLSEFRVRLFNQSRTSLPDPSPKNLLILSAPHEPAEAREILRESLAVCSTHSDALQNSSLHEIAILPRQSEPYAALLEETASARRIPVHNAAGKPLLQNIAARAYLKLLEVARTNLGRAAMMEFATLAPLDPAQFLSFELRNGFNPAEWDRLSSALGIVRFSESTPRNDRLAAHLRKLEWRKSKRDPEDTDAVHPETDREMLTTRALGVFVRDLSQHLRPILSQPIATAVQPALPQTAAHCVWSHLLKHSLAAFRHFVSPEHVERITAALAPLAELDAFQPTVTLDMFIRYVRKSLEDESIRDTQFEDGGIFIGSVMAARGLSWRTVILPGLVEKNFPRIVREDPILLDAERAELNSLLHADTHPVPRSHALPHRLDLKLRGLDEERLLFQLACESAREKLILTFPRLEPANGRPRVPSMLVLQSVEAVAGKSLELKNLRVCPLFREIKLNAPAEANSALDETEIHRALFHDLRSRNVTRIAPLLHDIAASLEQGLRAHRARWGESSATIYDGVFADKSALAAIAASLSPDAREFSATAFEKYAWCPRCYFEEKILGIEELDEPEETVMLPPLELGTLIHEILQQVVTELKRDERLPLDPAREPEHWQRIEHIAEKSFTQAEREGFTGIPLLWEIQKTRILVALRAFLADEYSRQKDGLLPYLLEWSFGSFSDLDPESADSVSIKLPNGCTLLFHGRVDRVDEHTSQHWLAVTDYKTGKPPSKWRPPLTTKAFTHSPLHGGQLLQIAIYAIAAQSKGHPAKLGAHMYLFADERKDMRLTWNTEMLQKASEQLPQLLGTLHELMSRGVFFQQENCNRCGGSTLSQGAVEWLYDLKHKDSPLRKWEQATRDDDETKS